MLIAAAAGLASGFLSVAMASGGLLAVILGYLAQLPVLLVGLGGGPRTASVAVFTAAAVVTLVAGPLVGALYLVFYGGPAWLVVTLAFRHTTTGDGTVVWYPPGRILAAVSGYAAAVIAFGAIASMGAEGGLEGLVRRHLNEVLSAMQMPSGNAAEFAEAVAAVFPAAMASSWVLMTVINAVLAQGALRRSDRNRRPSPAYADLVVPRWVELALVGAAIVALVGAGTVDYLATNLVAVLAAPFFFLGLAVVHTAARKTPFPASVLAAFYVFVMLMSVWALGLVAGLGLIEQWAGVRRRIAAAPTAREDE